MEWLRDGDRNTGFFQAKAKARVRSNKIRYLKNFDGELIMDQDRLEGMASEFFQRLFTAQDNLEPDLVCRHISRKVTDLMNELLDRPFTPEEIEDGLFQMEPNKAPGPDGFTAGFFQKH